MFINLSDKQIKSARLLALMQCLGEWAVVVLSVLGCTALYYHLHVYPLMSDLSLFAGNIREYIWSCLVIHHRWVVRYQCTKSSKTSQNIQNHQVYSKKFRHAPDPKQVHITTIRRYNHLRLWWFHQHATQNSNVSVWTTAICEEFIFEKKGYAKSLKSSSSQNRILLVFAGIFGLY